MFVCLSRVIYLCSYQASVIICIICKCMNSNISPALENIRLKPLWGSRLMSSVFVSSQNGPNKSLSVSAHSIRNTIPGSDIFKFTHADISTKKCRVCSPTPSCSIVGGGP